MLGASAQVSAAEGAAPRRRPGSPVGLTLRCSHNPPPRLATGVPPLPESPAAAATPARPDLAPCPAKMAAVRRARSYCRCLVRFSDRELC
ncbi:uncharacterized LOC128031835 homolog [Pongo abelii]|uniref:uncharacterized LOC128031835 homolog n=1 Tax=Pongo abelii TaxID=9601 RepID=UPI0024174B97|nr:uncharacterized LOC128031835 homolog [Pongo abelii]XP_057158503.1 uncharacterized LOC128031835 homolog [Pan paniscus]